MNDYDFRKKMGSVSQEEMALQLNETMHTLYLRRVEPLVLFSRE